MKLRALVSFSYQNRSFKNGQVFEIEDQNIADTILKSGHAVAVGAETEAKAKKASK